MADSLTSGTPTVHSARLEAMGQASSNSKTFFDVRVILVVDHRRIVARHVRVFNEKGGTVCKSVLSAMLQECG